VKGMSFEGTSREGKDVLQADQQAHQTSQHLFVELLLAPGVRWWKGQPKL
jgi:hypothetical protein